MTLGYSRRTKRGHIPVPKLKSQVDTASNGQRAPSKLAMCAIKAGNVRHQSWQCAPSKLAMCAIKAGNSAIKATIKEHVPCKQHLKGFTRLSSPLIPKEERLHQHFPVARFGEYKYLPKHA
ncbi:hypothetical protein [Leptothoe kymatousa]|uniref:Uncharacterized protein n=1 Tax=Leptothoe kymatousa TAU-MAC 1615 TaxID=2364775 RepID=A0ABS5Y496_9CYAN|nr:hypothetical protein [Leptothoe kymatousa]MBT9312663.1 hypothetical protein [Leptothoe kymatousa TAU-MAC 1615]